ncbi:aspartic proteinase nepenthesin-1-like isoform X5 [Asparagus officinalis]|uniref:aspartic proteinase nepenthesin-1-like isoform X3 n=1 Tax=Asparagus officinalis TaxID=4686 RepID=UPI00098E8693|nr:aspartic proteinase nepenthesin-1-like isoform X3 [Asparagus officinalis]XP_020275096.1 aspartic proteinase nepenthesin-1-like isoform X4 [Asparagus officinalis]XP_020275097.1 aspartic proteinase nepenthesin-1-like isoform X5 [Asparagus officinalis]
MAKILPTLVISLILVQMISNVACLRINLTHIDSELNLTKSEILERAIRRTKHKIMSLASTETQIQTPLMFSSNSYSMDFSIGSPSVPLTWLMDTGSNLIWTDCKTSFNPSNSSTFTKLPCTNPLCQSLPFRPTCAPDCDYTYSYVDNLTVQGVLASETFAFGSNSPVSVPGIGFGCNMRSRGLLPNAAGLAGLARGKLSLVSQLGATKFSYCLTSYGESKSSPLLLGSSAILSGSVQSTPFVTNPNRPVLYYLSLKGISVGSKLLAIDSSVFALDSDGNGGFVIDSGTTVTYLNNKGYQVMKQEFEAQVNLSVADSSATLFDLCFSLPSDQNAAVIVPELVFHFEGADMQIPGTNYFTGVSNTNLLCLAILPTDGISTLGNFQQQNMHILYDVGAEKLSFVQAQCDQV